MEIILKEDVQNLGYKGDVLKVKDGYGRNYLIPTKKAVLATESAKKVLAEDNRQRAHKLERIKNEAIALAEKLKDITLTIGAKTSTTGKIFGAVGPVQIADALEKSGYTVDRKVITLKEP
ncbi:MAG: 50S ribosomal protein L9, partial [Paludibacter sp.]|nr:50S ribosomal protein L9 [Paludibacter sp.]